MRFSLGFISSSSGSLLLRFNYFLVSTKCIKTHCKLFPSNSRVLATSWKSFMTMATKRIGTHNGKFHCDEALACFLLRLTDTFRDAPIVRTRDENLLSQMDCVVDVGGIYDPKIFRFDHHQRGFLETFSEKTFIPLSSAGLVYKHFGREILTKLVPDIDDTNRNVLFEHIYSSFVEELDAIDNGVNAYDTDIAPKYSIHTHLSARIGSLNPAWNESNPDEEAAFQRAMELAGNEFIEFVRKSANIWLPARNIVKEAFERRSSIDDSFEIVVLETACPWKSHLYELEEAEAALNDKAKSVKYVVYPRKDGSWSVQAVSLTEQSFKSRKPLPSSWRGLRDEALSNVVGISDCVFVHATGFIGVHKNYQGALTMARKALKIADSE
ncbi:hypothetical protein GpartN1_g1464.t1 [Galdieria partita]|uniref:Metal-dependent protein hydrolase n=1 Tax=Galdieria partita TaxID=83374 RepID=A0A9C7PS53_9RHOD|nr:hypothetical protein GpartN1_g1464.t1 [Galdieria partita]